MYLGRNVGQLGQQQAAFSMMPPPITQPHVGVVMHFLSEKRELGSIAETTHTLVQKGSKDTPQWKQQRESTTRQDSPPHHI